MYNIHVGPNDTLWTRVWDTENVPADKSVLHMIKKHEKQAAQYHKREMRKVDRFCWKINKEVVVVKVYWK
jgi:hypothetical protein